MQSERVERWCALNRPSWSESLLGLSSLIEYLMPWTSEKDESQLPVCVSLRFIWSGERIRSRRLNARRAAQILPTHLAGPNSTFSPGTLTSTSHLKSIRLPTRRPVNSIGFSPSPFGTMALSGDLLPYHPALETSTARPVPTLNGSRQCTF